MTETAAPLPDTIDLDTIQRLMVRLEAGIHRDGWSKGDDHLHLFLLHTGVPTLSVLGPTIVRDGPYVLTRLLRGSTLDGPLGPPTDYLRMLTTALAYPAKYPSAHMQGDVAAMRDRLCGGGVIAMMASNEGWARRLTVEELEESSARNFAERHDSVEMRVITVIDAWDRSHTLTRERGRKPEAHMDKPLRGDISTSLRMLVDMIYGRTPPIEKFDQHYPTLLSAMRDQQRMNAEGTLPPDPFL